MEKNFLPMSIVFAAIVLAGALIYTNGDPAERRVAVPYSDSKEEFMLPIKWGDLGRQMTQSGVIDADKLKSLYMQRGGLSDEERSLLEGSVNNLVITKNNAGFVLNLLWALGLGNKNQILESGPMMDSKYGGAGRFASTGGWTLAVGNAIDHYSMHRFVTLTPSQQALVDRVSKGIYRPCCGNSTHFPDCNHGMAMLGLLQLLAAQGAAEEEMYRMALTVNTYWFPDVYSTIKQFMASSGVDWSEVDAKQILGNDFSSKSGYRRVINSINTVPQNRNSGSCGV